MEAICNQNDVGCGSNCSCKLRQISNHCPSFALKALSLLGILGTSTLHLKEGATPRIEEKPFKDHQPTGSQAKDRSDDKVSGSHRTTKEQHTNTVNKHQINTFDMPATTLMSSTFNSILATKNSYKGRKYVRPCKILIREHFFNHI